MDADPEESPSPEASESAPAGGTDIEAGSSSDITSLAAAAGAGVNPVGAPARPQPGPKPKPPAKPGSFQPGVKPGARTGRAKPGAAKPGAARVGLDKPGAVKSVTAKVGPTKPGAGKASPVKSEAPKARADKPGPARGSLDKPGPAKGSPAKGSPAKMGTAKPAAKQGAGKRPPDKPGSRLGTLKPAGRVSGGLVALASATFIIVVVGIIIAIKLTSSPAARRAGTGVTNAPADVVNAVTQLPVSILNQAGLATTATVLRPEKVAGSPPLLTSGGKPELFFFGANYCPYCATERWPMIVALARFGTFSNLGLTTSSSSDVYPNTATFSFYGSSYTSKYLTFVPVELYTNEPNGSGGYTTLDTATEAQLKLVEKYDAPPYVASAQSTGGIPFQDYGNLYLMDGFQYNPQVLQGQTAAFIAGSLSLANSPIAEGVDPAANWDTAAICQMTNDQPSSVCSLPVIKTAIAELSKLKAP